MQGPGGGGGRRGVRGEVPPPGRGPRTAGDQDPERRHLGRGAGVAGENPWIRPKRARCNSPARSSRSRTQLSPPSPCWGGPQVRWNFRCAPGSRRLRAFPGLPPQEAEAKSQRMGSVREGEVFPVSEPGSPPGPLQHPAAPLPVPLLRPADRTRANEEVWSRGRKPGQERCPAAGLSDSDSGVTPWTAAKRSPPARYPVSKTPGNFQGAAARSPPPEPRPSSCVQGTEAARKGLKSLPNLGTGRGEGGAQSPGGRGGRGPRVPGLRSAPAGG